MRFLSVCSGMEAASVAWEPLGWKAVGFSEIEPFPCAVLAHRFPNTPNYGSLTEYQSWPFSIGDVDLLCGGTPCQSYSVAGKRGGLNDPRGQLMLSFLDLADKLKPRWIVWENVPGVLSSGQPRGADFATFLQGLVDRGYGWAYRVLDAQYFGVPQRRRRVFVVASLGGRDVAASVLLKPESLCWHPAPRRKKGQGVAADAGAGVEAGRPIAFRKSKRAQSTTDNEPHIVQSSELRLKGQINPQDTCPTLLANTKSGDNDPLAVHAITFQPGNLRREAGAEPSTTTTTTLKASMGDQMPHVACFKSGQGAQARSIGWSEDVSPTLPSNAGGNTAPAVIGLFPPMAVRRLTPVECERLQGFPDNWSQIPWKGKPADQCPDGPRYKCAGNSMAVPVMRWIGEQIARVELSLNNQTK